MAAITLVSLAFFQREELLHDQLKGWALTGSHLGFEHEIYRGELEARSASLEILIDFGRSFPHFGCQIYVQGCPLYPEFGLSLERAGKNDGGQ